jgi:hypothetical protein
MAVNLFETTSELYSFLQHITSDRNPTTATQDILLGYLNQAHIEIVGGGGILNAAAGGGQISDAKQWTWISPTEEILTLSPYEQYSVAVTLDSATATLDSAPVATRALWYAFFDNSVYKIASDAGATLTLDSPVASATGSYDVIIYKLDYTLLSTDIMRMIDEPARVSPQPQQLQVITTDAISDFQLYSRPKKGLVETLAVDLDSDDTPRVVVPTIHDKAQRIKFKFVPVPAALDLISSDPILPKRYRKMIAHLAAFYHLEKRDDQRAAGQLQQARVMFKAMCAEHTSKLTQQGKSRFAQPRLLRSEGFAQSGLSRIKRRGF